MPRSLTPVLLAIVLSADTVSSQDVRTATSTFNDEFAWVRPVTLEESGDAVNAAPGISMDPLGGLIVWDMLAPQIRLYTSTGQLTSYFGRRGAGPGEFRRLSGALRLANGSLLTADVNGRITLWSSKGDQVLDDFETGLFRITSLAMLGDTVIATTLPRIIDRSNLEVPVLHFVDIAGRRLLRSTLRPHIKMSTVAAWSTVNMGGVISTSEAIYVTQPIVDTLYILPLQYDSTALRRIPLRAAPLARNGPIPNGHEDREAFRAWLDKATFVGSVYGDERSGFCIQLLGAGTDPNRGVLYIRPAFASMVFIPDAPAVVAFDPKTGHFIFDDPDWLEPNRLRYARSLARSR